MSIAPHRQPPPIAFGSEDLSRANAEWGCNCGPASLSACLGWTLEAIRPHLGDFEARGYMTPTMMGMAIESAGFVSDPCASWDYFPRHGLARVQWGGPWCLPGVPKAAAYRYTHWVACKTTAGVRWVFDVNAGWAPLPEWERETVPAILATIRRADGSWLFTHRWEVRKSS